uniref:VWFA domain-containing protein n=1 Tax=Panagrellus redivivus TaxID=6233 RepID=A0A7E4VCJ7_PANRE
MATPAMRVQVLLVFFLVLAAYEVLAEDNYPCGTVVVFSIDASTNSDNDLVNQQISKISSFIQNWHLGFEAVRVGLPLPIGAKNGGIAQLVSDKLAVDDAIQSVRQNLGSAFQTTTLSAHLDTLANNYFWSEQPLRDVLYNFVIFTGSTSPIEIQNAARKRIDIIDSHNAQVVIVPLNFNYTSDFQELQTGGIINFNDTIFYDKVTSTVCQGHVIQGDGDPTPAPLPAYPGVVDIIVQFSSVNCPDDELLLTQLQSIYDLTKNYTFRPTAVGAAIPEIIGMKIGQSNETYYDLHDFISTFNQIDAYDTNPVYCDSSYTKLTSVLPTIGQMLNIRPNASAVVLIFSESRDANDIALAGSYRQKTFDSTNLKFVPINVGDALSLDALATSGKEIRLGDTDFADQVSNALKNVPVYIPPATGY